MMKKKIEPALLNMEEFCAYLSIGETKARELLHDPSNGSVSYTHLRAHET